MKILAASKPTLHFDTKAETKNVHPLNPIIHYIEEKMARVAIGDFF